MQADVQVIKSGPRAKPATGAKINYKDNFELVVMRWRELERSLAKNPDLRAKYQRYDPTIKAAARAFFRDKKYQNVLLANSHDEDDVYSYGRLWMVNYLLYERSPEQDLANDNERLLSTHLLQRMVEMIGTVFKKAKNCLPDRDAAVTFSLGGWSEAVARRPRGWMEDYIDDRDWARRNKRINTSETLRAPSARRLLLQKLAGLDHTAMIEKLISAAENDALCADSRDQARKLLVSTKACVAGALCLVCKTKDRPMDRKITPIIKDPKSTTATLSVPQANSLALVRLMVESVAAADDRFERNGGTTSDDPRTVRRAITYYRQAARVLGFLATNKGNEWSPTKHGFELIEVGAASHEERLMFRERILVSPPLEQVRWFFTPGHELHSNLRTIAMAKDTPKGRLIAELDFLAAQIAQAAKLSDETARRRASTLVHWRDYAWDGDQLVMPV